MSTSNDSGAKLTLARRIDCDKVATLQQTVTVYDATAPVQDPQSDTDVECGSDASPSTTGETTATDNCGGIVATTHTDDFTPTCGLAGTIERTWTSTDECGNTASYIQVSVFGAVGARV